MSPDACLALLLDGPMQSWGFASRFTRRTTALHPTKSAVIGILAAAAGIDKQGADEPARLAPLAALGFTAVSLPRNDRHGPRPVRRLSDYHTIGGGYDRGAEAMKKPRAASGATLETVLSERHYLLDARFGILLEGERALLDNLAASLRNPRWGVWLGRKCCLPASPLLAGVADDFAGAFRLLLARIGQPEDQPIEAFDRVIDGERAEGLDGEWSNDQPTAFGAPLGERHSPRRIRQIHRA